MHYSTVYPTVVWYHRNGDGGMSREREPSIRDGVRAGLPLLVPTLLAGTSFGVVAGSLGWGIAAPVAMSVVVFSSSAQFAAAGVLAAGGGVTAALGAGALVNLRFLPLGLAAASALRGGPLRRAIEGQAVVDGSVALAVREDGVKRGLLLGATIPQAVGWVGGTALGAAAGLPADPARLGIDAVFPAFFLALLVGQLAQPQRRTAAVAGAALALATVPFVPPGLPVVLASLVAFVPLRRVP